MYFFEKKEFLGWLTETNQVSSREMAQKAQAQFLALTRQLTTICHPSSR